MWWMTLQSQLDASFGPWHWEVVPLWTRLTFSLAVCVGRAAGSRHASARNGSYGCLLPSSHRMFCWRPFSWHGCEVVLRGGGGWCETGKTLSARSGGQGSTLRASSRLLQTMRRSAGSERMWRRRGGRTSTYISLTISMSSLRTLTLGNLLLGFALADAMTIER
eukprot:UN1303